MTNPALIRMHALRPVTLTTDEYERLGREVRGRVLAQDAGIADLICLRLLEENAGRYHEAVEIDKQRLGLDNPSLRDTLPP
jgi:hypothetical protein